MTSVELDSVTVRKTNTVILHDLSLRVGDGRVMAVLGASGSGKTSVLRAVAGLDPVACGAVRFDGVDVTNTRPAQRRVAFVFQQPVLFPKRSVGRNIAFPLEVDHQPIEEIRKRVGAEARALHIESLLRRHPRQLSVGEAQVVQIARALVKQPAVLLLDEPFGSVDVHQTAQLRREVMLIQHGFGVTTVIAANEATDAMTMADDVAVLDDGRVVQVGQPLAIYEQPRTVNAALFTGAADVLEVDVTGDVDGSWLVRPGLRVRAWAPAVAAYRGRRLQMVIRPEWWQEDDTGLVEADVVRVDRFGAHTSLWCRVGGQPMTVTLTGSATAVPGERLRLRVERYVLIDPRDGFRIPT